MAKDIKIKLNTFQPRTRTEYVPYEKEVTVHEHRAPTDESIRLFDQYLEKVKEYIIDCFEIKNNVFEATLFVLAPQFDVRGIEYGCKIKLNGKELYIKDKIDVGAYTISKRMDIVQNLFNSLSKHIALEIIKENQEFITKNFR